MTSTVQRVTTDTGDSAWLVTGYETIRSLLGDSRLARSHPNPQEAARLSRSAAIDPPRPSAAREDADHRHIRRLLLSALSAHRVAAMKPAVSGLVAGLLSNLERMSRPADFHAVVSEPLPAMVICEILGLPQADLGRLLGWSAVATETGDSTSSHDGFQRLRGYMDDQMLRRTAHPRRLLAGLARAYSPSVAASAAAELFIAGHQTTTAAIDKALVLLLTSPPDVRRAACHEVAVVNTVEELMRLPSPVAAPNTGRLLPRYARAGLDVAGEQIHPGDLVLLALDEANVDCRVFDSPTTPDFQRSPNPHLGFGFGRYSCVGAALARLEMHVLFDMLFQQLPDLELAVPTNRLRPRHDQLMGGIAEVPVTWG